MLAERRQRGDNSLMQAVYLLIESSRAYGRGLLHGIAKFLRMHNDWTIIYRENALGGEIPVDFPGKHCDGVIARIDTARQMNWLLRLKVPVVEVRGRLDTVKFPRITIDDKAVAEMAAQHLLARGLRHFAFCGFAGSDFSQRRRDYFNAAIRAAGYTVQIYESESPTLPSGASTTDIEIAAASQEAKVGGWLSRLPRLTGLLACNDVCGRQVLHICHTLDMPVPDHLAVIGVDNDEILCDLAEPPMSSVILPTERMGYQAADLLANMMNGMEAPRHEILVPPIGVMKRRSTDAVADDACVAAALRFIREKACTNINVDDILDHLAEKKSLLSRSTLDRRFEVTIGRSPKQQILEARMERVRQLLLDTTCSLEQIASLSGFADAPQLSTVFKRYTGQAPGEFRRSVQPGPM